MNERWIKSGRIVWVKSVLLGCRRVACVAGHAAGAPETCRLERGGGGLGRRVSASLHAGDCQHPARRSRDSLLHQPSQGSTTPSPLTPTDNSKALPLYK